MYSFSCEERKGINACVVPNHSARVSFRARLNYVFGSFNLISLRITHRLLNLPPPAPQDPTGLRLCFVPLAFGESDVERSGIPSERLLRLLLRARGPPHGMA